MKLRNAFSLNLLQDGFMLALDGIWLLQMMETILEHLRFLWETCFCNILLTSDPVTPFLSCCPSTFLTYLVWVTKSLSSNIFEETVP